MDDGSLLIMKQHCQSNLLHEVPPELHAGPRFCLSFRKAAPGFLKSPESSPEPVLNSDSCPDKISSNIIEKVCEAEHLIIGDSLTRGIEIPNSITLTKPGAKPCDIIPLLQDNLDKSQLLKIKSVIIVVGTNSVSVDRYGNCVPIIDVMYGYRTLVTDLLGIFPNTHIGLFNIPPKRWYNHRTPHRIKMFNMFLDECADTYDNVTAIRMFEVFLQDCRLNEMFYKPDGLHFSPPGTAYLTECFKSFQNDVEHLLY